MKNVTVLSYVGFKYPVNVNALSSAARNHFSRLGYRVRGANAGSYNTVLPPSYYPFGTYRYDNYLNIRLTVPDNHSVSNVRANVIAFLRSYGTVAASYAQLGEDTSDIENNTENDVKDIQIIEEEEPSADNSWLWTLGGLGGLSLLLYLGTRE